MKPDQIALVQSSFALVKPIAATAAELFYGRLFALDPSLRPLFKGDMAKQGQMLMSVIGTAVAGLRNLEKLAPVVRQLGARHVAYGVRSEHYATVGAALLWTLEQGLGEHFTPEVREAWAATYELLAEVMQLGALDAPAPGGVTAAATA
ncbi:MAG TPA: globin family protein [Ramlibacter sp.]|nr:globin family protein [Ramlibacter sp.]